MQNRLESAERGYCPWCNLCVAIMDEQHLIKLRCPRCKKTFLALAREDSKEREETNDTEKGDGNQSMLLLALVEFLRVILALVQ